MRTGRQREPRIVELESVRVQRSRRGGVYFVRSGDFVKIGVSTNVVRRVLGAAQSWNPHPVEILGWIHEPDCEAAQILERTLHQRFAVHRHRLEWFHTHEELMTFIEDNAKPFPPPRWP